MVTPQNAKVSYKWAVIVTVSTFVLSMGISYLTSSAEKSVNIVMSLLILLVIMFLGIVFDLIGVAVATASETPFHSMASSKVKGGIESVKIIRHAQQISSFCNDVIGDISGIISGALMAVIVLQIATSLGSDDTVINLVATGIVASIVVGGKAVGKGIAIKHNNFIVYLLGYSYCTIKSLIFKK